MENIVNIHLTLLHKEGQKPLYGDDYTVRFYDRDFLKDDFLGETKLDEKGHTILSVTHDDFSDSFAEKYPDLYFVVLKKSEVIFMSKVYKNLNIEVTDHFPASDGFNFQLGTFLV